MEWISLNEPTKNTYAALVPGGIVLRHTDYDSSLATGMCFIPVVDEDKARIWIQAHRHYP
jgi:hypothetical protein